MERVECVVIGAGVIGLAVGRALALAGREVIVVESEGAVGHGISSRNSEVIHAGIYYPTGSLKARLCVAGRDRLYAYCAKNAVAHRRLGKLIVASSEAEHEKLGAIRAQAEANGVDDLVWLDRAAVNALEPAVRATAALLSPSTGIIDSDGYMRQLHADCENAGGMVAFNSRLESGSVTNDGVELRFAEGDFALKAERVINCAALAAHRVSASIEGLPRESIPDMSFAKGNYFSIARRAPFSHLIYPVPEPGGLGIHLTLDLAGGARFGPDVEPIDELSFEVDPARAERFYAAIRRYWPDLEDGELAPAFAGIRPKINGLAFSDFSFSDPLQGKFISLYGIESPGLTSSLAIADEVLAIVEGRAQA